MALKSWRRWVDALRGPRARNQHPLGQSSKSWRPGIEPLESRTLLNAGSLDVGFANQGVLRDRALLTASSAVASAAVQTDGKIVVVGLAYGAGLQEDFAIARYTSSGIPDIRFGSAGLVTTDLGARDVATSVAIDGKGRILVTGSSHTYEPDPRDSGVRGGFTHSSHVLLRYTPDGSLDTSFGNGGKLIAGLSSFWTSAGADWRNTLLALDADARILVAGPFPGRLARFTEDGKLDVSFGTQGKIDIQDNFTPNSINLDDKGRIVLAGFTGRQQDGYYHDDLHLRRYSADGILDSNFGSGGSLTTDFGEDEQVFDAAIDANGRILVAGATRKGWDERYLVARYDSDGSLDSGFGVGGKLILTPSDTSRRPIGEDDDKNHLVGVAVQLDGKIVVAGRMAPGFELVRLNADGTLDSSFGAAGRSASVQSDIGRLTALVQQPDGQIVLVRNGGYWWAPEIVVTRFANDAPTAALGSAVGDSQADAQVSANERFVGRLYRDLLYREPDAFGLTFWVNLLDQGSSHAQIVRGIETSREYSTLVVQELYLTYLHRRAEQGGLEYFAGLLGAGQTVEEIRAVIASSPEYLQQRGAGTAAGYLDALYGDALHRPPDPLGQAFFRGMLAGVATHRQVADIVFGSDEHRQGLVGGHYRRFLRREAEDAGLEFWATVFQGQDWERDVLAGIAGSAEYRARS